MNVATPTNRLPGWDSAALSFSRPAGICKGQASQRQLHLMGEPARPTSILKNAHVDCSCLMGTAGVPSFILGGGEH